MTDKIRPNDIKKGDIVRLKDGENVKVMDNRSGIVRTVKTPMLGHPGMFDTGSMYIDEWYLWIHEGKFTVIEMTESQRKQMATVRSSLERAGW